MRWGLLCVGRLRSPPLAAAIETYVQRLAGPAPLEVVEVKEGAGKGKGAREAEGERLLARLGDRDHLVALDPTGRLYDTESLAARLSTWRHEVAGRLWLCIGGADGLGAEVIARADERLSLSPLTLSHELARLVLAEQLYRCHTLLTGHPYHH
jgi:23S rRNA (pseudouridine1915-N3)-methyltransferase